MEQLNPSDLKAILHSKRANVYYLEYCRVMQLRKKWATTSSYLQSSLPDRQLRNYKVIDLDAKKSSLPSCRQLRKIRREYSPALPCSLPCKEA